MLSYGRLTVDFGIVVFAKTRWLFSYGVTFLPDAFDLIDCRLIVDLIVEMSDIVQDLLFLNRQQW